MEKRFVLLIVAAIALIAVAGCGDSNYLEWLSNDGSSEACSYDVTMALDSGDYDFVVDSSCANEMDLAAAYLGLAGFDIATVINKMIEANDTSANSFEVYMSELIANVTTSDIQNLDRSKYYYGMVTADNGYSQKLVDDAAFYNGALVGPVISFTYIKSVLDPDGDGVISTCDLNNNTVPDEVDAAGCAMLLSSGQDCSSIIGITVDDTSYQTLDTLVRDTDSYAYTSIFNGVIMDFVPDTTACPTQYKTLLYNSAMVAVTALETCEDAVNASSIKWNCPYEDATEQPVSLLDTFNDSLTYADEIVNSLGMEGTEVDTALSNVTDGCDTDLDGICDETELQIYLSTQLAL